MTMLRLRPSLTMLVPRHIVNNLRIGCGRHPKLRGRDKCRQNTSRHAADTMARRPAWARGCGQTVSLSSPIPKAEPGDSTVTLSTTAIIIILLVLILLVVIIAR